MTPRTYYLGQFKSDKKLIEYNYLQMKIICIVLHYLSLRGALEKNYDIKVNREELFDFIYGQGIKKGRNDIESKIESILMNMGLAGLIFYDEDCFFLLDEGKKACMDHRYTIALASLCEAKQSRKLASAAIWVAIFIGVISISITLFLEFGC